MHVYLHKNQSLKARHQAKSSVWDRVSVSQCGARPGYLDETLFSIIISVIILML